jgi:hypothetical protein
VWMMHAEVGRRACCAPCIESAQRMSERCTTGGRCASAVLRWVFVCGLPKLRCTMGAAVPLTMFVPRAQLKVLGGLEGFQARVLQVCGGDEQVQGVAVVEACCASCAMAGLELVLGSSLHWL